MVVVEDAATAAEAVRRFREERVGLVSRLGFGFGLGLGSGSGLGLGLGLGLG